MLLFHSQCCSCQHSESPTHINTYSTTNKIVGINNRDHRSTAKFRAGGEKSRFAVRANPFSVQNKMHNRVS